MVEGRAQADSPTDWNNLASRYDRQLGFERAAIRAALALAAPGPQDDLLDVGTGTGAALRELAANPDHPRRVLGIDPSIAMLARVPTLPAGWEVRTGDVAHLPFPDDSFLIVLACYVLHVVPRAHIQHALAEIRRVLAPDGRLVAVTPVLPGAPIGRAAGFALDALARRNPDRFGGLRAYDPRPALVDAGFHLVRARYVRRGYPSLCVLAHVDQVAASTQTLRRSVGSSPWVCST